MREYIINEGYTDHDINIICDAGKRLMELYYIEPINVVQIARRAFDLSIYYGSQRPSNSIMFHSVGIADRAGWTERE